jgi:hypothetical protein
MVVDVLWTTYVMALIGHVCRRHCEIVANVFTKVDLEFLPRRWAIAVNSDPGITFDMTITITHPKVTSIQVDSFVCIHYSPTDNNLVIR